MGGGSKKSSTEYKVAEYYLSVDFGICHGPLDSVNHIFVKEELVWSGTAVGSQVLYLNQPEIFGGEKKEGGIRGIVEIYDGSLDQKMSDPTADRYGLTPDTMPGYRGIAHAVFRGAEEGEVAVVDEGLDLSDPLFAWNWIREQFKPEETLKKGFMWVMNNPYMPSTWMNVTRVPVLLGEGTARIYDPDTTGRPFEDAPEELGALPDANPAQMIYECLVDDEWGLGALPADVGASFAEAAATLYAENFGLTMTWTQQSSVEKFIQEIADHILAMIYLDPETGLWEIKLIRADYDVTDESLVRLDPSNTTASNRQRKAMSETINEIVVSYTEPATSDDTTITFQDIANVAMQGGIRSESRNYYGIRNPTLAATVGARDLRSASYPLFSCDLSVDTTVGKLKPGQVVLFSWPDDGIVDMPLRVYKVDYGKIGDTKMKVTVTEDVFGLGTATYDTMDKTAWQDPDVAPVPLVQQAIITPPLPLLLRSGVALEDVEDEDYPSVVMAVLGGGVSEEVESIIIAGDTVKPNGEVVVDTLTEIPATPVNTLSAALVPEAATVVSGLTIRRVTRLDAEPDTGDFLMLGTTDTESEIVMLDSYDSEEDEYTIARGMMDTVPRDWAIGTPFWFLDTSLDQLDPSEQADGVASYYKLRTSNSSGTLGLDDVPVVDFTPTDRPYAPHRPADTKLNAVSGFTETSFDQNDAPLPATVTVTWVNRNRLDEDTVPPLWTAVNVTPEVGQTTTIRIRGRNDGIVYHEYTGIAEGVTTYDITLADFADAGRYIDVEILAVRDGFESIQPAVCLLEIIRTGYGNNYGNNYGG